MLSGTAKPPSRSTIDISFWYTTATTPWNIAQSAGSPNQLTARAVLQTLRTKQTVAAGITTDERLRLH
jgi:hypothetical protein